MNSIDNQNFVEFLFQGSDEANSVQCEENTENNTNETIENSVISITDDSITEQETPHRSESIGANVTQASNTTFNETQTSFEELDDPADITYHPSAGSDTEIDDEGQPGEERRTNRVSRRPDRLGVAICAMVAGNVF